MTEHLDVVIVGAGISGVSAAWHLQDRCPTKSYAILEKRESMGGTWDLFRYPGIRSDSDMYTLGFRFRPWTGRQAIADGKPILEYVKSTAAMYGIDRHIRFHHKVISADWSTAENRWTVHIQSHGTLSALTCEFLFLCSGYYNYDEGYSPRFAGSEDFVGPIIHPQHWPEDLDYDAKNIVVIGSGATAVTLVPALADSGAKHVTMLQRSPTTSCRSQTGTASPRSSTAGCRRPWPTPRYGGRTCCARRPCTAPARSGHGACGRCS